MIFPASLSQSKRLGQPRHFPVMPVGGGAAFVGALDGVPNLVHLWSVSRLWLSSHFGNSLIRLRRDSDNAELDFGHDADGNLDVAAIITWLGGATGYIVTKYDQKSGDDVSQATAGNQPLYVASGQGGRPVGRYNGTSQFLQGAFTSGGALSQPFNAYAAARNTDAIGNSRFILDGDDLTNRAAFFQTVLGFTIFSGASLVGGTHNTNWHVWSALFNGASSQFWHDGTSQASGNAGTQNADGITIGARPDNTAFWQGDIATIAIADPNHDTANRETVQAALGDYYIIP